MCYLIAWTIGALITVGFVTTQNYRTHAPGDQVAFWLATLVVLITALWLWPRMLYVAIRDGRRRKQMNTVWPKWRRLR